MNRKQLKTFFLVLGAFCISMVMSSCSKDLSQDHLIDVSFNINSSLSQQVGLKLTPGNSINWSGKKADYVMVIINDEEYILNVSYVGNLPYTNTIKLPAGTYILSEVIVYNDNHNNNSDDDIALAACPHSGSGFAGKVQHPLSYVFTVSGSAQLGLPIEVIGYSPKDYKQFGFTYF